MWSLGQCSHGNQQAYMYLLASTLRHIFLLTVTVLPLMNNNAIIMYNVFVQSFDVTTIIVTLHEKTKHNALDVNLRYRP